LEHELGHEHLVRYARSPPRKIAGICTKPASKATAEGFANRRFYLAGTPFRSRLFALAPHRDQSISVRSRVRSRFLASFVAALAVLLTPALLFAHARLLRSSPAAMSTIAAPPTALRLWFSERPELRFSSIELVDSAGMVIPLGPLAVGDSMSIVAAIPKPLAVGRYSIAWRTAASDGHSTNGRFTFVVASPADTTTPVATPPMVPRQSTSGTRNANAPIEPGGSSVFSLPVRWAELVAAMVLVGAVVFRLFILPAAQWPVHEVADATDRTRRLAASVAMLFLIASITRLIAQSDLAMSPAISRGAAVMSTMRYTRWGHGWTFSGAGAAVALVGLLVARTTRSAWILAGIGAVAVCVGEAMTGHPGAMGRLAPLAVALDVAHFLSAGGWLGGLTCVLLCGLPALRAPDDATRSAAGSRLVRAYHRTAVECVAMTILSALIAAWLRFPSVSDLWTTDYGLALLRKVVVVVIVLAFGLFHWRRAVVRDWAATTAKRFRISATLELLAGAVVLALTTVLISTALPPIR
jgi:putative copper export protein/methionine-rich copper-binding protein CopC